MWKKVFKVCSYSLTVKVSNGFNLWKEKGDHNSFKTAYWNKLFFTWGRALNTWQDVRHNSGAPRARETRVTRAPELRKSAHPRKFWLLALFWISLKRLDRILFKPHHTTFMIYITMSEPFVKIEQDWFIVTPWNFKTNLAYEPAKNLPYNIHCFLHVMLIFPNWCPLYIPQWLVQFSMNLISYFECKTLTIFTLKCTGHRGVYGEH